MPLTRDPEKLLSLINALQMQLDALREQNVLLQNALVGMDEAWPHIPGITTQMETLLRLLWRHEIVTRDAAYITLFSHRIETDWPDPSTISVQISKMRPYLPPNSITTIHGRGWQLTASGRQWLAETLSKFNSERKTHGTDAASRPSTPDLAIAI